jgi:hypothetical protein
MGYGDGFLRVYLNTKWSCINGFLAMDEAAGKPCHKKRGYEVFHECEIEHDGKKIGSSSMKKTLNG